MDDAMTHSELIEWKIKRRNTLIGFVIIGTAVGIDASVIVTTLYYYLRDFIQTDKPELHYGLIIAVCYVAASLSGIFFGRWLDKTRKVRLFVKIMLTVQIVGFVFYLIPCHPAFQFVGRTLCGIGIPFLSVVTGEVFRIYDKEESTRALLWLASVYSFGFMIGPSLNWMFEGIEFHWGWLKVNKLNFIAIFMAILLSAILILAYFLVHDCSAQFDLKEYLQNISMRNEDVIQRQNSNFERADLYRPSERSLLVSRTGNHRTEPVKVILKRFATDPDIMLIFVMSFVYVYSMSTVGAMVALIVPNILLWNATALNAAFTGYGIGYLVFVLVLAKYCKKDSNVYVFSAVSMVANASALCVTICIATLHRSYNRDICLFVLLTVSQVVAWFFDDVLVRVLLAKRIPSSIQSFGEGMRAGVTKCALIFGALTASVILPWLQWWSSVLLVLGIVLLLLFIVRRENFLHPLQIVFNRLSAGPDS